MLINKNIKIILISLIILLNGCGFKVLDKSDANNFSIKEIVSSGDKRINFSKKLGVFGSFANKEWFYQSLRKCNE